MSLHFGTPRKNEWTLEMIGNCQIGATTFVAKINRKDHPLFTYKKSSLRALVLTLVSLAPSTHFWTPIQFSNYLILPEFFEQKSDFQDLLLKLWKITSNC